MRMFLKEKLFPVFNNKCLRSICFFLIHSSNIRGSKIYLV